MLSVVLYADKIVLPTHTIEIEGQKYFQTEKLQEVLSVDTQSALVFWKEEKPRIADKLIPTLERTLTSFYSSEGFYDANFSIEETNTSVNVYIKEKKPVKVTEVNITSDYNISSLVHLKKGDIFRAKDFVERVILRVH